MNFFRTLRIFRRNPFINPQWAAVRHVGWQLRKGLNRYPCVLTVDGIEIEIRNRAIANGCGALLNGMGYYDPNNMYLLKELFQRRLYHTFLDIGSNIGVYALIVGKHSAGQVHAFEPHPFTFELLQANVRRNYLANVHCYGVALSEQNGSVGFEDQPGSTVNKVMASENGARQSIVVETMRGDHFCQQQSVTPEVLKIDVEGHELPVLRGFGAALAQVQLLLIETASPHQAVANLLRPAGFHGPFKVDYRAKLLSSTFHTYEDWIFIKPAALQKLSLLGFQPLADEALHEVQ
jgi:FkbM family methyltransferase